MGFGDLKSDSGLAALDSYLLDKSYIEGYVASQADTAVFGALAGAPNAKYVNALRWWNHINSYDRSSLPGVAKPVSQYGSGNAASAAADDDDDVDLFGSDDDDDAEAERVKAERLKAYQEKKSKKPALVAKSIIMLDVKPWDDETDMKEIERLVRTLVIDGLVWGASKLIPLAYGIHKLQIACVVEDDKVGTDTLEEEITKFEDFVQSVDVASFQKV